MSKIFFNEHQRRVLKGNLNVTSVSNRMIQYTPEFKIRAVKENLAGKDHHRSSKKISLNWR